ncbi:hypothetical protein LINGRAPRIM_LOCUS2959 [Linum grandiflorum]
MMKLLRKSPVPAAAMARNALKVSTIARNIDGTKRVSKEEELMSQIMGDLDQAGHKTSKHLSALREVQNGNHEGD